MSFKIAFEANNSTHLGILRSEYPKFCYLPGADLTTASQLGSKPLMTSMMDSDSDNNHEALLDAMSIGIFREKETAGYVDYVFIADVWGNDPRNKRRLMLIGQRRGLFRIEKASSQTTLLRPMFGDEEGKRFERAARKVQSERLQTGTFPEASHYASG